MTARPIRAIIVDDELLARQRIRSLLNGQLDIQIIKECTHGAEAVEAITKHNPDLVFLDVQMPEVGGLDVIAAIGAGQMPAVIFVTAYDQYAVKAFDLHAVDYLLKPYEPDRFRAALDRARTEVARRRAGTTPKNLEPLIASLRSDGRLTERLALKSGDRLVLVNIADIDWIESAGNYVTFHVGSRQYLLRDTMHHTEQRLEAHGFVRIHRSTIVNTDRIQELRPLFAGDYQLLLTTGHKLTLSRRYRPGLRRYIRNL